MRFNYVRNIVLIQFVSVLISCIIAGSSYSVFAENPADASLQNTDEQDFYLLEADRFNTEGMNCLQQQNNEGAEKLFRSVIILRPKYYIGYNNLAASLMRQKRYTEAVICLEKCLSINPHMLKAMTNMAIALFHCGEYRSAYSWYCKAKIADREYVKSRFDRNKMLEELDKKKKENPSQSEYAKMAEYLKQHPHLLD